MEDPHTYLKKKGSFQYAQNIRPEYYWYNGRAYRYLTGDKIDPSKTVQINYPLGDASDPEAKIWPFKVHRGRRSTTQSTCTFLAPRTSAEGGYWSEFDWTRRPVWGRRTWGSPTAATTGSWTRRCSGPSRTWCSPRRRRCSASTATGRAGVMDWERLGFDGDPAYRGNRRWMGLLRNEVGAEE